jgi:VWFA-related protein
MARVNGNRRSQYRVPKALTVLAVALPLTLTVPALKAQSADTQSQPPATSQPAQEIPDAPSAVQPPTPRAEPTPEPPESKPPEAKKKPEQQPSYNDFSEPGQKTPPPPMPPVTTVPAGTTKISSGPANQINPKEDLYTIVKLVNFVQIPVMVKYSDGRPVDGLVAKDFTVLENGKKQNLTFFTSDPFQLSAAVVLDIGMADVAVQKLNESYSALVGAFSPYDEVALYTFSSTVSQVADFTSSSARLTSELNQLKLVRGHNNGPPVLGGPLGPGGPTVNGAPVGGPIIQPVNTPPKESHVLNDAILRAALDLSKRDRARRKVIFVISDGRERGSSASYRDVLRLLETRNIQVKAIVVDMGALPVYKQLEKFHLKGQGFGDILPKYSSATGGGEVFTEISRNSMEEAYAQVVSEARNQYTLGYAAQAITSSAAYRDLVVTVDRKGLKVFAKDGYYPIPNIR